MGTSFVARYRRLIVIVILALVAAALLLPAPSHSLGTFVYELVRRCPDLDRRVAADSFLVIGHRGAAAYAVENTIPSMAEAIERGANAIEIDLSLTRDSALVLWHDWLPDDAIATARQKGVEADVMCRPLVPDSESPMHRATHLLTLAELREHYGYALRDDDSNRRVVATIPTLGEFLGWASGASGLRVVYLDIKVPSDSVHLARPFMDLLLRAVARSRARFEIVYLVAAENVYREVEPMVSDGRISYDREPPGGLVLDVCEHGSVVSALANGNSEASIVVPVTSTFGPWTTARRIAQCDVERSQGRVRVMVSTMNDPEKLECLVGLGVDGIITDMPDRLRRIVGGAGAEASERSGPHRR